MTSISLEQTILEIRALLAKHRAEGRWSHDPSDAGKHIILSDEEAKIIIAEIDRLRASRVETQDAAYYAALTETIA